MAYRIRPMSREDIEQVKEIDLLCFPTMMPPTSYQTELINPMAHYIVAYDDARLPDSAPPLILGFAGLWLMAGEAHIINLAVRPEHRRRGIGELLLISLLETVLELKAGFITLEVRPSNQSAQGMYAKYGFTKRGVRRAYYTDNGEDAVIMTLDDMSSPGFQSNWEALKRAYEQRWGVALPKATH